MARLQKFEGTKSLPGVGSPQVVADTAVGVAVAGLGRQIGSSAGDIGDLAKKAKRARDAKLEKQAEERQRSINAFEVNKHIVGLNTSLREREPEQRKKTRAGHQNYSENGLAKQQELGADLVRNLPETVRTQAAQQVERHRSDYKHRLAAQEYADSNAYYQQSSVEIAEQLAIEVRENPDAFDGTLETYEASLEVAPLPISQKEELLRQGYEMLAQAWMESRPVQEQIEGLTELKNRRDASTGSGAAAKRPDGSADLNVGRNAPAGAGPKTDTGEMSVFESRAQFLPPHTQNRLLADAKKKQAAAIVQEEERIATLIAENPLAMNPQEIHEGGFLEAHQQKRLLDDLREQIRQQERDLEAVGWLGASAEDPTRESSNQELADRAFAYLDDGETDRDALALGMLRNKGVLPDAYLKSLENTLNSSDPAEVGKAFDILAEIGKVDPNVVEGLRGHEQFRSGVEKQDILVNRFGFSLRETSADLAQGNDPVRRKDLRTDFAGQYPQGRTGRARAQGRLAHHSASGYGSSPFPVDELLNGVDFVERGGNSAGEIQVAGGSAGLRLPGGPPLITPLDPDKPSAFYDGATPNEAATSALPYLRFMLDLMNPSATASALFNKNNEISGGDKSANNGKPKSASINEDHTILLPMGKGGKQNHKESGIENWSDEDVVEALAEEKAKSREKKNKKYIRKLVKEEKARKFRNKKKR